MMTATPAPVRKSHLEIPEPNISKFLFADTRLAPLWTLIRLYVGYEWLIAGWGKLTNPAGVWVGEKAGTAVTGFLNGALTKTDGAHPDVQGYSAWFLQNIALPNASLFSYLVTFGEIAVGIALIMGLFTGIAAFFGGFMNASYLLAGTVSTNPVLFILAMLLVLAWRTAGYWGLDRWVLPRIGVPGYPGPLQPTTNL
jgi:thiosulfate dehydrogenase (quinone) large subunit